MSEQAGRDSLDSVNTTAQLEFMGRLDDWGTTINTPGLNPGERRTVCIAAVEDLNNVYNTCNQSVVCWGENITEMVMDDDLLIREVIDLERPTNGVSGGVAIISLSESGGVHEYAIRHQVKYVPPGNYSRKLACAYYDYHQPHYINGNDLEGSFARAPRDEHLRFGNAEQRGMSVAALLLQDIRSGRLQAQSARGQGMLLDLNRVHAERQFQVSQLLVEVIADRAYAINNGTEGEMPHFRQLDSKGRTLGAFCVTLLSLESVWLGWQGGIVLPDQDKGLCMCLDLEAEGDREAFGLGSWQVIYVPMLENNVKSKVQNLSNAQGGQS